MDWWIEALRALREVRDWPDARRNGIPSPRLEGHRPNQTPAASVGPIVPLGPAVSKAPPPPQKAKAKEHPRPTFEGRPRASQVPDRARKARREEGVEPRIPERQEIPLDQIDPQAVAAVRRLRRYGFKAYLVGGCVRDLLLGLKPKDFDVATDARPEEVKSIFRNSRIIGRRFRLVHLYFQGGKVIEISTFRANLVAEDDADDSQDLLIRRDNVFGSEEEDALRRDFTINALFYDVTTGKIIDHIGGMADIRSRYLRMIGDPDVRLREDPVRILRAIRFTAKTDVRLDPELRAAMSRHKDEIRRCPPARVLEETLRLLRIGHSATTVRLMDEMGVLKILLPEIHDFFDGRLETPEPYQHEDASEMAYAHLRALDTLVAREPVSDAVVLAALIYAPVYFVVGPHEESRDRSRRLVDFLSLITQRMTLTRRLNDQLRQLFLQQRILERGPPKSGRKKRRGESPSRRGVMLEALQVFEIHLIATGRPLDVLAGYREEDELRPPGSSDEEGAVDEPSHEATGVDDPAENGDADTHEGNGAPPRRRRRGGRGRRRTTSPSAPG